MDNEPIAGKADDVFQTPPDHDCLKHPKISHTRWIECQFEARDMLEDVLLGIPDPMMEAIRLQRDAEIEQIRRLYESKP